LRKKVEERKNDFKRKKEMKWRQRKKKMEKKIE
jgi:hypothetical protein